MSEGDDMARMYRGGNDAITAAYQLGIEHGRKRGRDEQARDHHQWLLNHDDRLALVATEARREALTEAADAWDSQTPDSLRDLAEREYHAGGPSMPTTWLRLRAEHLDKATS